jgi:membrane-associated phospholipid phosphatase
MRRALGFIDARVLPRGWRDLGHQIVVFVGAYFVYEFVRGLTGSGSHGYKPFGDAVKIINFERALHVFAEPSIQAWAQSKHLLIDALDWTYLNGHYIVTLGVLIFIYVRRNDSFYFMRNMFIVAMGIALVGYWLYPTAPPRLMPEWGFTDSISRFMGLHPFYMDQTGPEKAFVNFYAAVPSMHVCFAIMTAWPMATLVKRRPFKIAWSLYPLLVTFAVVATGNHYFIDVVLGALTAGLAALCAKRLLARARPGQWAFRPAQASGTCQA